MRCVTHSTVGLHHLLLPTGAQKYWSLELARKPYRFVTAKTFQDVFVVTDHWRGVLVELDKPFDESGADPHALAKAK